MQWLARKIISPFPWIWRGVLELKLSLTSVRYCLDQCFQNFFRVLTRFLFQHGHYLASIPNFYLFYIQCFLEMIFPFCSEATRSIQALTLRNCTIKLRLLISNNSSSLCMTTCKDDFIWGLSSLTLDVSSMARGLRGGDHSFSSQLNQCGPVHHNEIVDSFLVESLRVKITMILPYWTVYLQFYVVYCFEPPWLYGALILAIC